MVKYVHYFSNVSTYNEARNNGYEEPWLSATEGVGVNYNKKMREKYLTFDIVSGGTVMFRCNNTSVSRTISYSLNGGNWTSIQSWISSSAPVINVNAGDELRFKGTNNRYGSAAYSNIFDGTATYNLYGNIMSLIGGDNFSELTTLPEANTFRGLFSASNVISCENLELPATTLIENCYYEMFLNCTQLTKAPKLPATTLATGCYHTMFRRCSSLTTAPKLPATTLAQNCYSYMFSDCTGLTEMPSLTATTIAQSCCSYMFSGCTGLTTAHVPPATTAFSSCYYAMFDGCTNLTTIPILPATTLADGCYKQMFHNCTSLTTAPVLPAETLVNNCYYTLFNGCSNLNYIKAMFTTTPGAEYTNGWVSNVSSTGTFVKNSAAEWDVTGSTGVPTGWTVETASE